MPEVLGVRFDDRSDIIAVDRQVVEVGQQCDICRTLRLDRVDDFQGLGRGFQRIGLGARNRLNEHRAADLGNALRCRDQVFQGQFVLGGRAGAVDADSRIGR